MFENIGEKIKKLAVILCWGGIVLTVVLAILMFVNASDHYYYSDGDGERLLGWILLVAGPISSLVYGYIIYGFGELVEKATEISDNLFSATKKDIKQNKNDELKEMLDTGLITEEEYNEKKGDFLRGLFYGKIHRKD